MSNKENPKDFTRDNVMHNFAKLAELVTKDLNNTSTIRYKSYKRDDVTRFLGNPIRYAKELQAMSSYLYNNSPHYRRLVNYYAKMSTMDYFVEPYGLDISKPVNEKTLRNNYTKAVDLVDLMSIKHEYQKAMVSAWKLGTFYGYEIATKESYFIFEIPYEFCQISGIMDGVLTFNFDVSYFDKNPNDLELYPKEFKSMYNSFKSGSKGKWQEIEPTRSVCIKINEENHYDIPPFAGIFYDIFDIEDFKTLRKVNAVLGNYKFIVEKIPMRKDSEKNNDFLVDLKTVGMFHNKTANLLPEEVGIFSTPFDIDTVEFSKDKSDKDTVDEAERGLYSASGTSQQLFNGSKSSQSNLAKSINVDEAEVFALHRQIERIISFKLKNEIKGSNKFRLRILDNTIFNKKENTETLLKNAQFGLPVKIMLCASLGLTPSSLLSMNYLENDILGLSESFTPLSSSHTQSTSDEESGRQEKSEDELSEKGEEQREREDNENRE